MEDLSVAEGWQELQSNREIPRSKPATAKAVTVVADAVQSFFSAAQGLASACAGAAYAVFTNDPAAVLIGKLSKTTYPFQDTDQYEILIESLREGICSCSGDSSKVMILHRFVRLFSENIGSIKGQFEAAAGKEMHRILCNIFTYLSEYLSSLKDIRKEKKEEMRALLIGLTHFFE